MRTADPRHPAPTAQVRGKALLSALALSAATAWTIVPAAAAVECAAVAFDGQVPPDTSSSDPLSKNFRNHVAVNAQGDTLFVAQPVGLPDRLYLYRSGSVLQGEAVATGEQAAPNGKTFKKDAVFRSLSINSSGDFAFAASLNQNGQGLFVRHGAAFMTAADNTPAGGGFAAIQAVSLINAGGQIAFAGTTDTRRVIRYDPATNTRTVLMEAGQLTDRNRQVCNFAGIGLGDSGEVVVHGPTKLSCADAGEEAVDALFYSSGGSIIEIAEAEGGDDPTPLGSTWYSLSLGAEVFMNASGHISFRGGVLNKGTGLFLHDPAAGTTRVLAFTTDRTPQGALLGAPSVYRLSDSDDVVFAANLRSGSAREGIYLADGGLATILTRPGRAGHPQDQPPAPFASTARYTDFFDLGMDVGGTRIVFRAAVLDSMSRARQAVVTCTF